MSDLELPTVPAPSLASKALRSLQWIVFSLVLILALTILLLLEYRRLPGFPETAFWLLLAAGFLLVLWHLPKIFFGLSRGWRIAAYVCVIPFLAFWGQVGSQGYAAYHRTPEGAKVKANQLAEDARLAKDEAERTESKRILDAAAVTQAKLQDYNDRLEDCFSSFGHRLAALETEVKETLHNPGAFEHIETIALVPDEQGNNVGMRFRAENGFGALRAATVKARIDINDCSVQNIGETVVSD